MLNEIKSNGRLSLTLAVLSVFISAYDLNHTHKVRQNSNLVKAAARVFETSTGASQCLKSRLICFLVSDACFLHSRSVPL